MGTRDAMSCRFEERTLLLDEADGAEREIVLAHVAGCARCAADLRALAGIDAAIEPGEEPIPFPALARIRALPEREPAPAGRPVLRLAAAAGLVAAAAVLAVLLSREAPAVRDVPIPPAPPAAVARVEPAERSEPDLRSRVLEALAAGDEAFLDAKGNGILFLLGRIATEPDPAAARAAIDRLGRLGRTEALPALAASIAMPDRRNAAIAALAALGDPRAVRDLAPLLADEAAGPAAAEAIARLGGDAAARALGAEIARRGGGPGSLPLVSALARADGRTGVREMLARLDDPDLGPAVLAAFAEARDRLVPHLVDAASGRDRRESRAALRVLAFLAPPEAIATLGRLLSDRDRRDEAARALVRIGTPEAGEALLSRPLDDEIRGAFRDAGPDLVAWLGRRAREGDLLSSSEAVELLGFTGRPEAIPILEPLAAHRALSARAVSALGRLGGPDAVAALSRVAEAEPRLKPQVVDALAATGEEAAEAVLALLAREGPALKSAAVRALASLNPGTAKPLPGPARTKGRPGPSRPARIH